MSSKVVVLVVVGGICVVAGFLMFSGGSLPTARPNAQPPMPTVAPPDPAAADREAARVKLLQMKEAMDKVPRPRSVVLSGAEKRPGESQAFFEERQRTIGEWNHFVQTSHLNADQANTIARLIADAQDTWTNGLAAAHRTQPEAMGSEMNDPVLSQLVNSITEEFHRSAREAVPGPATAILHSFIPNMLPYVRTRVFDTPPK